jgi:hypothetical protein
MMIVAQWRTIMPTFGEMIQRCRDKFGSAPREMERQEQDEFRLRPSFLMRLIFLLSFDKLRRVVRDQNILRDHGQVVWGFLVQANQILFNPKNRQVLPANVIYSPDTYFDNRPEEMQDVAGGFFQLKGTAPGDKEMERFANAITDELARTMKLPLPRSLCQGKEAFFTTCLIQPSHLPQGYLASGFFPLVICPEKTEAVMILPARYWPKELRESWAADQL